MFTNEIYRFRTIEELQSQIEKNLEILQKKSEEYSKIIGDKLRENQDASQDADLNELKEKLNGPTDPKKKKSSKSPKKDKKSNWHTFDMISIFDGIGIKGELELYFKALEEMKSKIENLQKAKESTANLIAKGIKRDLSCVALMGHDSTFEVVFVKSNAANEKRFTFKSIFTLPTEPQELDESQVVMI